MREWLESDSGKAAVAAEQEQQLNAVIHDGAKRILASVVDDVAQRTTVPIVHNYAELTFEELISMADEKRKLAIANVSRLGSYSAIVALEVESCVKIVAQQRILARAHGDEAVVKAWDRSCAIALANVYAKVDSLQALTLPWPEWSAEDAIKSVEDAHSKALAEAMN